MEEFKKAREIAWKIMNEVEKIVVENKNILEIAEFIENKILSSNAKIAFPVNISVNHIAAHYTPEFNEAYILKKGDLVKIDFGTHINGYIADIAKSFCIGEKSELIKICEKCLNEALKVVKEGNKISEVGNIVEEILKDFSNVRVVRNLCGHRLDKFDLHARPSILNYKNNSEEKFEKNQAYAIEIFLTNGNGWVKESSNYNILQFNKEIATRNEVARKILGLAKSEFEKLPFAKRWLYKYGLTETQIELAVRELVEKDGLIKYPFLIESGNGLVAQAEDTVIIE